MVLFSANENDNLSILTHHSQQAEHATMDLQVPLCFLTVYAHFCVLAWQALELKNQAYVY